MTKLIFAMLFLMILVACDGGNNGSGYILTPAEQNGVLTTTLTVRGMTCPRCVTTLDREILALSGVISVSLDLQSGVLVVEHEPEVSVAQISDIVILEGFRIE